ncbi:MAG: signal peptidase I [Candidatus Gottesmanbacteria bacterium]
MKFFKTFLILSISIFIGFILFFLIANFKIIPGIRAFIVLSGSMEPAVKTGSIAITAPSKIYFPGDIVSFQGSSKKDIVTHRLVAVNYAKSFSYYTAGDANKNFDQQKITDQQILGKVILVIPYLGYIANSIKTPYGFILFVIVPITILVYEELKKLKIETLKFFKNRKKELTTPRGYLYTEVEKLPTKGHFDKLKFIFPGIMAFIILIPLSLSYFSDQEQTLANTFQAGVWVTPTPTPTPSPSPSPNSNLFLSEYIEGSSNNKALEIYNPTLSTADLSNYYITLYRNGSSTPERNYLLSGSLLPGSTYVICHPSSDPVILSKCQKTNSNLNFNGDDTLALMNGSIILDVLGQIGNDPGTSWGTPPITTNGHTLVRKCTIIHGDTNGTDSFNPSLEWDGYPINTFTYLGSHSLCP